jgi:hypothetical protein
MGTLRRVFVFAAMSASAVHAVATSAADQPTTTSVVATVVPSASDSNSSVPAEGDDLGPTSAPPWNPPRAISARRTWEVVVLAPGRIVSLPLSGLGYILSS